MPWLPAAGICIAGPATALAIAVVSEASGAHVAPNVIAWDCEDCVDAGTGFADVCIGSLGTLGMIKPEA